MERYNVKEVGVCRNNKHETFWTIDDKEDELPLVILVSRDSAERLCEYLESQDLVVTEDITALINLMNDYNLTWPCVYNIIKEAIEDE